MSTSTAFAEKEPCASSVKKVLTARSWLSGLLVRSSSAIVW